MIMMRKITVQDRIALALDEQKSVQIEANILWKRKRVFRLNYFHTNTMTKS